MDRSIVKEAATMARCASGVTPGASAFDALVVIVGDMFVDFVGVVELVLGLVVASVVVGAFVLSVTMGSLGAKDSTVLVVWRGAVLVVVVAMLVLVVVGG